MDPERWKKITEIFHAALARESGRRAAFVADACGDDTALRAEVDALLAGDAKARAGGDPFQAPAAAVASGTTLGPYRIESALGAGGMGEVYKARDTRLNRSVAIKVLPAVFANEPELRQRFEREAQAIAALRHPHICVLYDIGHDQGVEFLVMEHLEGETLEQRLKKSALPLDRALQYAGEIAEALQSAHRAGITHRDLKPGNVMLTKEGVKLLDFGLAKFSARAAGFASATALPTTPHTLTSEGTIVGTFQYMAPEQLEGKDADARTDLFAFGAVVYEMITGRRAFAGDNRSSLIAAILRDEPPPLSSIQPVAPPALDAVVRACLAKDPDVRLQSAHDAALQLRWIRDGLLQPAAEQATRRSWRSGLPWIAAALAATLAGFVAYTFGGRAAVPIQPTSKQLTFRRGFIDAARFTPDGQSVVYTAAWDGKPRQIFSMRVDTGEALPLPLPGGQVLSISKTGELAFLAGAGGGQAGTLARVPLGGGGVREVAEHVIDAAWAPDGTTLAALFSDRQGHSWLEYPIGKKIHEWSQGSVLNLNVSRDGAIVSVGESNTTGGGWIAFVDRQGTAKRVTREFSGGGPGMVWTSRGDELWFTASNVGLNFGVYGVTRDGRERIVYKGLGSAFIQDLNDKGRALVVHEITRGGMVALAPGEQHERDLSWLDFGRPSSLSADGRLVSFTESGAGVGPVPSAFVRKTDGSPAIRIAEGQANGLSPDGTSVLLTDEERRVLKIVPIGAGQARLLDTGNLAPIGFSLWTPDGSRVVFRGGEPGRPRRIFSVPVAGGPPRPVTPEGVQWFANGLVVSPDSRYVLGQRQGRIARYPIGGGDPLPIEGLLAGDQPLRFSSDGRSLWVLGSDRSPAKIFRFDLEGQRRTLWREISQADPAGLVPDFMRVLISADGASYVYGYARTQSDLYVVDGVK
jgi:serine/threonine protein kinase/Tol biopolymer transport system component